MFRPLPEHLPHPNQPPRSVPAEPRPPPIRHTWHGGGMRAGRLAVTAGERPGPLTGQERTQMPGADTIWLIELAELTGVLREATRRAHHRPSAVE